MVCGSFGLRLGRVRYHCNARQRFLMLVVSPAQREDDVCEDSVTHDKRYPRRLTKFAILSGLSSIGCFPKLAQRSVDGGNQ